MSTDEAADGKMERRLAAILAADIAGYSALMGADEARTVRDLKAHQAAFLPMIGAHGGSLIDTAGDGFLAEFASVVAAVECALAIQRTMAQRNGAVEADRRMHFRMGINVGDIIHDEGRIFGDGINVASRLEGIAEPGGICVSRRAYDLIDNRLSVRVKELGPQELKNIAKPVDALAIEPVGPLLAPGGVVSKQEINYCRTPDGVRLAWARAGSGPPLVRPGNWLSHLEYEWESPLRKQGIQRLAKNHTLIRYDARGNGLSDWDVPEVSLDAWVSDLETVVDAAGLDRFPLLALSQGCAVAITYAVRHPERVTRLVLCGGFARGGNKRSPEEREARSAMLTLMRLGWGADDPGFRQLFTSRMMPEATKEQADAFNELQRRTTSPECAARYFETVSNFDLGDLPGKVTAPTLVMHVRGDLMQPFDEGRRMASQIPNARFVALQGNNHMFLPGEPAAVRFVEEVELFLSP